MNEMCIYISDLRLSDTGKGSEKPNATSLLLSEILIIRNMYNSLRLNYEQV